MSTNLTPLPKITFQHNGTVTAGEGLCTATFDRLTLNINYETWKNAFLKGSIPHVDTDAAYVERCRDLSKSFPTITKSSVVETSDNVPLAWFIKGGMTSPWGRLGRELTRLTNYAVWALTQIYTPPTSIVTDPRHALDFKEESTNAKAANIAYGVYHFFFWRGTGGRNFGIHTEARPSSKKAAAAVEAYLYRTKWQHILLSKWFKALAPAKWHEYWTSYQERSQRGELGVLDAGEMGCFSSQALLIQAIVNPHKDHGDVRDGVVFTTPTGWFGGGEVNVLEWGMRFQQQATDILIAPMQVLTHFLEPVQGIRHGHVYTVHEEVLHPPARRFSCGICKLTFVTKVGVDIHMKENKETFHQAGRLLHAWADYRDNAENVVLTFDEFRSGWTDPAFVRVPCDFPGCDKDFSKKGAMLTHKAKAHGEKRGKRGGKKGSKASMESAAAGTVKAEDVEMEDVLEREDEEMEDELELEDRVMEDM